MNIVKRIHEASYHICNIAVERLTLTDEKIELGASLIVTDQDLTGPVGTIT